MPVKSLPVFDSDTHVVEPKDLWERYLDPDYRALGKSALWREDPETMWEEGHVALGFDAEERLVQKLPHVFGEKVVWGSRYPHHDTTSAWDAIDMLVRANVPVRTLARMMGGNAAEQFGVALAPSPV